MEQDVVSPSEPSKEEVSDVPASPLPRKIEVVNEDDLKLDFPGAMREIIAGNRIHKLEWKDPNYFAFMNGEILSLHKTDNKNYQWIISLGDIEGDDYIVLPPIN